LQIKAFGELLVLERQIGRGKSIGIYAEKFIKLTFREFPDQGGFQRDSWTE
jgi:hypothetical protein